MSGAIIDPRALLRQLQKARAVAKCITLAVDHADADLDLGDAVGGLAMLIEGAIESLDQKPTSGQRPA